MSETILIVDDTPANLGVLVETLGAAGYRLQVAEDGEEALAQTSQTAPDLILLDVMMPGLDGFETCRRLKAQPSTANTPVLFMTALNETPDKVRAFAAGGVDYITKPIEHEEALARVRTHLALRRLQRQLAEELALKERFMRIASHDLRNPVCLILIATEMARRTAGNPELLAQNLGSIGDSVAQIRRIIDTFLGIRGSLADCTTSGELDAGLLAQAVIRQYEPMAHAKRIALHAELPDPVPAARGDATLAYQMISNLLNNALKFTPVDGAVTVRVTTAAKRLRVAVEDSGPGVPPAERDQLFRPGARLSVRPSAGEESHGQGLAIVRQLAEAQGGAAGADFPNGGGSLFWFELPRV